MAKLLVVLVLLLGNAFFVGGEFALIAARRTVVEPLAAGSKRARLAVRAMEQIPLMIAGSQLGVTVCSLGLGAIAEPALARLLAGIGARRAGPVTPSTSLTWTNPRTRRVSRATTGNRDRPVRVASTSSAAGDTSSVTVVTDGQGSIASATVRSCSASAPVIRACSSWSSSPSVRACATRPANSSAV